LGIIIDEHTRVLVQGITGTQGSFHTKLMQDYGTKIVAGTSPGKGGTIIHNVPVYDSVEEASQKHPADTSVIFVPAVAAFDAVFEAITNEIKTIVIITEHMPVKDTIELIAHSKHSRTVIIGPNTPGIINPGSCKVGILPSPVFSSGNIGIVSRSGTLTYEIANALTQNNMGQSTCLGLGGDTITGMSYIDALKQFEKDEQTKAVVLIGEIGGNLEELTADYIVKEKYPKPVVAFVAGISAPPEKRMGHAGAIIMGTTGTARSKIVAFEEAGVRVAEKPGDVVKLLKKTV
jgi:succinyl-CoA synthetase alpha subunit